MPARRRLHLSSPYGGDDLQMVMTVSPFAQHLAEVRRARRDLWSATSDGTTSLELALARRAQTGIHQAAGLVDQAGRRPQYEVLAARVGERTLLERLNDTALAESLHWCGKWHSTAADGPFDVREPIHEAEKVIRNRSKHHRLAEVSDSPPRIWRY